MSSDVIDVETMVAWKAAMSVVGLVVYCASL